MRSSKGFLIILLALDFISSLMAGAGYLYIKDETLNDVGNYLTYYWSQIYTFLLGYPLQVLILISATAIVAYLLEFFGFKVR
ncbi:MAG: hypothetical protein HZA77_06930 [Candidatus Schekmanbacteria bacterium]|nr:hypothetical protein [Candidatus Schekmanbacteria bacterium]